MTMKMLPSSSSRTSVLSRFRRLLAACLLPVVAAALSLDSAHAQTPTSAVPGFISYQGKVSNADGSLVGATALGVPVPTNRIVTFRIWSHQGNSTLNDLVYSEQQTVTISSGEFSVLIGQGTAVSGTPLGYSEASKGPGAINVGTPTVFGGASRFLGVTIDDGNSGTLDPEISPRQQLVTSAYAFRAKYAESVGSNGVTTITTLDSGNVGIGTANPGVRLDVVGSVRTGGIPNASFVLANSANNNVGTVGAANGVGALSSDATANDVVVRAEAGKLLLQTGVGASALVIDSSNRVGIGTSAPNATLDVNGGMMIKTTLTNASGRPAVGAGRLAAEIGAYSSGGAANDDGFLRLSAGGGTNASTKSFIDLTGFSTVPDMNATVVFGTAGAERMRIINSGALLLKGGLTNASTRPAVASSRLAAEIAGYGSGGAANDDGFLRLSAGGGTTAGSKAFIDLSGFSTAGDMNQTLVFGTASAERMRINLNGDVGIGTTAPSSKLNVVTAAGTYGLTVGDGTREFGAFLSAGSNSVQLGSKSNHPLQFYTNGAAPSVTLTTTGNFGVGTATPSFPLQVQVGVNQSGLTGAFINSGIASNAVTHGVHPISIYSAGSIWCANTVIATSDARTKLVQGRSLGAMDLKTLMAIQVTDYRYKDTAGNGSDLHKKVIAQQVESVYPQAVGQHTGTVPDIFHPATIEGNWIHLATDLKQGERVRLVVDSTDGVHEVLEATPDKFRTAFTSTKRDVFVYGREVNDFRTVDYDAISMLNVSATQELKREKDAEVAALRSENAELRGLLAELKAEQRARDAKLASIEKLLQSASLVMAQPATANGQQ